MRKNKIVYSLNVEDVQNVAQEMLERDLSDQEIESLIDSIAERIDWYSAVEFAISNKLGN